MNIREQWFMSLVILRSPGDMKGGLVIDPLIINASVHDLMKTSETIYQMSKWPQLKGIAEVIRESSFKIIMTC